METVKIYLINLIEDTTIVYEVNAYKVITGGCSYLLNNKKLYLSKVVGFPIESIKKIYII